MVYHVQTLLSASEVPEVQLPHVWTVCKTFLCCYDVCARYTVGVEDTPGRVPQYSDNAERITTVDWRVVYTVFVPFQLLD